MTCKDDHKWLVGKYLEGAGRNLFGGTKPAFVYGN